MKITYEIHTDGFYNVMGLTNKLWAEDSAKEYVYGMGGWAVLTEKHDGYTVKVTRYELKDMDVVGDGYLDTDDVVEAYVVFDITE